MNKQLKKFVAAILCICMVFSGMNLVANNAKAEDTLTNVTNNRGSYTFMTSNANTPLEGFLYVGNGFSAINACNENLGNGNNLLGATATTNEVAVYVDLGKNYDISSALIYQGSTNANFYDSYCRSYSIYYSEQQVNAANSGNITWNKAGTCTNGTIYSGAKRKNAEYVSDSGDAIAFTGTYKARSVKIVFNKEACMGTGTNGDNTGTTGTVSLLSVRVYGTESAAETVTKESGEVVTIPDDGVTDILFIGNSFTYYNTLCNVVKGLAEYRGHSVSVTAATNGGKDLVYQSTAENVLAAIQKGGYDVVILQDKVGNSFDGDVLLQGSSDIIPIIKQYSPNARLIYYEPWPTKTTIKSTMPYFTYSYIQAAKTFGADLAPAGESFYDLYVNYGMDYYCSDDRHPQPLGTFNSASAIYYTLYPDEVCQEYTAEDQTYLSNLINTNIAYSTEGQQSVYSLDTLNLIASLSYKYSHGVIPAVEGTQTYTSVAGPYSGSSEQQDETLYASLSNNLALSGQGYASSNLRSGATAPLAVKYLTDGNTSGTYYIIANTTGGDQNPWFAVDLGSVQDINKVVVTPGAEAYTNAYPVNYKIQVASETSAVSSAAQVAALTWNTVATVTDGTLAAKSVTFPRKNARYVRVLVESYADYCSLYELSVYATDDSRLLGEEDNIMNVLFIGNSMTYYNTLCEVVEGFANAQGKQIQCSASTQGGKDLIYHTTYSGTVSAIQSGAYDVVVLQDIVGSFDGDKLMEGATTLTNMVKEYNPDAKILLYMPWPVKGSLTGENSLLPYFTYHYIKTARSLGATLAPAGEAWYELYQKYADVAWYCDDEKHPHAIGTFVSACSVYYALFPEAQKVTIDSTNQAEINKIINDYIAYSGDAVTAYEAALLDDISYYAYTYAHAVTASVEDSTGKTKYTSVAGIYEDADDDIDKEGLTEVTGEEVDSRMFTRENGNIAVGCGAYASNEKQNAAYATDGNTDTRWETDYEDPQWLYVDLGATKNIDKVGFIWEGAYASKYYIQVSDDAQNWTTVAMVTAASNKTVQIDLDDGVSGRYVRMYGTRRGTQYGYSLYEMGVWEKEDTASVGIEINGYQISTTLEGHRVIYSLEDTENVVESSGLIYAAKDYAEITDMVADSTNNNVKCYASTEIGKNPISFSSFEKGQSYTMTMLFVDSIEYFSSQFMVRAYAKLKNGQYVYSDVETYTIYDIADLLYKNRKMNTATAHNYLYEKILQPINTSYETVDYDWGDIIVKPVTSYFNE